MGRLITAVVVFVCLNGIAQAESRRGVWLRRLTLAASCGTSFLDLQTTRTALSYGARESNRLFTDGRGNAQWGRMIGFKVGQCAAMGVAQELLGRNRSSAATNYAWSAANSALAGRFLSALIHNRRVTADLKQAPAYLLKPNMQ